MAMIIRVICSYLLTVGVALAAPSQPSVSGTVSSGQTLTVSGSSFGSHADYHAYGSGKLPARWVTFESALQEDGFATSYPANWTRETTGGRSGYWAHRTGSGNVQGLISDTDSFTTGVFYQSVWLYVPTGAADGKTIRYRFDSNNVDYWYNLNSGNLASDAPDAFVSWGVLNEAPKDTWFRLDMLLTSNSQSFYIVGVNSNNPIHTDTRSSIVADNTVEINLGAGYDSSSGYWGFDDLFVNYTQARVEICNSATWSSRSQCEVQIPTSWGDTSISVTANTGGFAASSTVYAYVIDSSGGVSPASSALTVGGEGGSTITCYQDADNDLYGHGVSESVETCSSGYYIASHFTSLTGDCDDTDADINPGAAEICGNSVDEDCSGSDLTCPQTGNTWYPIGSYGYRVATNVYYVAKTGNDTTGNGSVSNPWLTIQKAVDETMSAGDVVYVRAGTYAERVDLRGILLYRGSASEIFFRRNPLNDKNRIVKKGRGAFTACVR